MTMGARHSREIDNTQPASSPDSPSFFQGSAPGHWATISGNSPIPPSAHTAKPRHDAQKAQSQSQIGQRQLRLSNAESDSAAGQRPGTDDSLRATGAPRIQRPGWKAQYAARALIWKLPIEIRVMICQYLSRKDVLFVSLMASKATAHEVFAVEPMRYEKILINIKLDHHHRDVRSLMKQISGHLHHARSVKIASNQEARISLDPVFGEIRELHIQAIMFVAQTRLSFSATTHLLACCRRLPWLEYLHVPTYYDGDVNLIPDPALREPYASPMPSMNPKLDEYPVLNDLEVALYNDSVEARIYTGKAPGDVAPAGKFLLENAPPRILRVLGNFAIELVVRRDKTSNASNATTGTCKDTTILAAPYAPSQVLECYMPPKFALKSLSIINVNPAEAVDLDHALRNFVGTSRDRGFVIDRLRATDCVMTCWSDQNYSLPTAYDIKKIRSLRLFNPVALEDFVESTTLTDSDLRTFILLITNRMRVLFDHDFEGDYREYLRMESFKTLARHCHQIEHVSCHMQDSHDLWFEEEEVRYHQKDPSKLRAQLKEARQDVDYNLHLLAKPQPGCKGVWSNTIRTISVRIGHYSEVPDKELAQVPTLFPGLNDIGLPCPILAMAVQAGGLNTQDQEELVVMARLLGENKSLQYIHLIAPQLPRGLNPYRASGQRIGTIVLAEDEDEPSSTELKDKDFAVLQSKHTEDLGKRRIELKFPPPGTHITRHPSKNLTPIQRVAFEVLSIFNEHCRQLRFFSITLRDFENPRPEAVHIRVKKDDVFDSALACEKELNKDMEIFGDMEECKYETLKAKREARYWSPSYPYTEPPDWLKKRPIDRR